MIRGAILLGALLAIASAATAQSARERAEELARTAVEAMDDGRIIHAIALLDSAIALDRHELSYRYEKGYALLLNHDYPGGLAVIEPLLGDTAATDYYYQLAAALRTAQGDSIAAVAVLKAGIERFPGSGLLHLELGSRAEAAGSFHEAVAIYERGMRAQPAYPDNYYRAALILANSSERIWGLIYGEMFMNLERESERTQRMGALLLETYRKAIEVGGDSAFALHFSQQMTALHAAGPVRSDAMLEAMARPEWLYEMTAMQAIPVSDHCRKQGVTLDCLDQFRTEFTRRWFDQKLDEKLASPLFEWHRLLLELGYFDEYNHWLLGAGDPQEFYTWVESQPEAFELFQKWFRVNGMVIR
jgi:tetratricopeptide (TPR) repeat protein